MCASDSVGVAAKGGDGKAGGFGKASPPEPCFTNGSFTAVGGEGTGTKFFFAVATVARPMVNATAGFLSLGVAARAYTQGSLKTKWRR